MGTQNSDVDYDWLPEETLQEISEYPQEAVIGCIQLYPFS